MQEKQKRAPGAGRKPLPHHLVQRPRMIRMDDELWDWVKKRGGSEFIRETMRNLRDQAKIGA